MEATVSGKCHVSKQLCEDRRFIGSKVVHRVDVLPALKDGASTAVFPSPIEGSGTTWV